MSDKRKEKLKSSLDDHVFNKHTLDETRKQQMLREVRSQKRAKKTWGQMGPIRPVVSIATLLFVLIISSLAVFNQDRLDQSQGFHESDVWIYDIVTSSAKAGHGPDNTIDGDLQTWWSGIDSEEWIQYDFRFPHVLYGLQVVWQDAKENQDHLQIEVSMDGDVWTEVWDGTISNTSSMGESYLFIPTEMRYVKLTTLPAEEHTKMSISSIVPLKSQIDPIQLTASAAQNEHTPENTVDGDLTTRWSANGQDQWIEYKFDKEHLIEKVAIAWYDGNERKSTFRIEASRNGEDWDTIFNGVSSGNTTHFETYNVQPTKANYMRIVNYGNTINDWNSITQVMIR